MASNVFSQKFPLKFQNLGIILPDIEFFRHKSFVFIFLLCAGDRFLSFALLDRLTALQQLKLCFHFLKETVNHN